MNKTESRLHKINSIKQIKNLRVKKASQQLDQAMTHERQLRSEIANQVDKIDLAERYCDDSAANIDPARMQMEASFIANLSNDLQEMQQNLDKKQQVVIEKRQDLSEKEVEKKIVENKAEDLAKEVEIEQLKNEMKEIISDSRVKEEFSV